MKRWTDLAEGRNIFAFITVIIVDDGLAYGFTLVAVVESLCRKKAGEVTVAVPVATASAFER